MSTKGLFRKFFKLLALAISISSEIVISQTSIYEIIVTKARKYRTISTLNTNKHLGQFPHTLAIPLLSFDYDNSKALFQAGIEVIHIIHDALY